MKAVTETTLAKRIADPWGKGHFGAPRNGRTHNGQDYCCPTGAHVLSPVTGVVTKVGFPYGDDLAFRYVQVTDSEGYEHRVFYLEPLVKHGEDVPEGSVLGLSQDLSRRYRGILQHVHYEIRYRGEFIDPEALCLSTQKE